MTDLQIAAQQGLRALKIFRLSLQHPDNLILADKAIADLETALKQPEQKPVAWFDPNDFTRTVSKPTEKEHAPLYTHPPREWRSLSEKEIGDVFYAARNAKLGGRQ